MYNVHMCIGPRGHGRCTVLLDLANISICYYATTMLTTVIYGLC